MILRDYKSSSSLVLNMNWMLFIRLRSAEEKKTTSAGCMNLCKSHYLEDHPSLISYLVVNNHGDRKSPKQGWSSYKWLGNPLTSHILISGAILQGFLVNYLRQITRTPGDPVVPPNGLSGKSAAKSRPSKLEPSSLWWKPFKPGDKYFMITQKKECISQMLNGTGIFTYIYHQNYPNAGK